MNTFSIVQRALDSTEADPEKVGLDADTLLAGRVLAAVQVVVDALTPPDGGRYIVGFANVNTAATSLAERRIIVSSKPLHDRSLSMVEKAVVIATFAAHEIGHTVITRPRKAMVKDHNPHSGFHSVANLADDIVLEPFMTERNPILEDAFRFTGEWVLRTTSSDLPTTQKLRRDMTTPERFNMVLMATRYGDIADIIWPDAASQAERDWARDWAKRLIATPVLDHATYFALCDEVWTRVRSVAEVDDDEVDEPEPIAPPPPDEPGDESEDGESDDEGGQGEGDDESDDDESEDADDDEVDDDETDDEPEGPEGPDGGDEPPTTDGPEGPTTPSFEQPDSADWDDGEGEPEPTDAVSEEPDDPDGATEVNDEVTPDAEGGGGAPDALRDEDDFNDKEIEKTTHDQAERAPYDYDGDRQEQAARLFSSTSVTAFGQHGSMSTQWD